MRRSARIAELSHPHAETKVPARSVGRRCRPQCPPKPQAQRPLSPRKHPRPLDKWARAFAHQHGVVSRLVIKGARSIRSKYGRPRGTVADDVAALWLAMKLLNLRSHHLPRLAYIAGVTGVPPRRIVEAELRLCRAADWSFAGIMLRGEL